MALFRLRCCHWSLCPLNQTPSTTLLRWQRSKNTRQTGSNLTSVQKDAPAAEAGSFTPVINVVYQADSDGMAGTPISAGEVFCIYQYTLSLIGLAETPGAVPTDHT
jgi:hypothetical protein